MRIQLLLGELALMDSNNFPGRLKHRLHLPFNPIVQNFLLHECDRDIWFVSLSYVGLTENVGVGEREARIASDLVAQRHYR